MPLAARPLASRRPSVAHSRERDLDPPALHLRPQLQRQRVVEGQHPRRRAPALRGARSGRQAGKGKNRASHACRGSPLAFGSVGSRARVRGTRVQRCREFRGQGAPAGCRCLESASAQGCASRPASAPPLVSRLFRRPRAAVSSRICVQQKSCLLERTAYCVG